MRSTALSIVLAAAAVGTSCQSGDTSEVLELKFAHVGAPGSLFALSAEEFARRVDEALDGRVRILVFGSSQLGGDAILLQKLKLGTLNFALPSTIMSSTIDEFGLFEMPYLVSDRAHMRRIEREIVWPRLAPLAEEGGYKIIAVWENGFRHVTNNTRPIVVPSDLRGVKLRTPRGVWRVKMFKAYGANPTPMPLAEVFVALQTGVMDGQENPLSQIHSSKLQEVQEYLSLTGHVYTPAFVAVGLNAWNKLPLDVRLSLEEIARETQEFVTATAERFDAELLDSLHAAGIQINDIDRSSFIEASRGIYDEFASTVPGAADLVEAAIALQEAVRAGQGR